MPQYFLSQANVSLDDFAGEPGFSGSHDKTIELVTAGSFETGVLNSQVWESRLAEGEIDLDKVTMILETPAYHDYHWVIRPDAAERFGDEFTQQVTDAFLQLDASNPDHAEILDFFGAAQFIATENGNYDQIEAVGREIGQIVEQ
jgi:phosphonate transport system substrate-binding protein